MRECLYSASVMKSTSGEPQIIVPATSTTPPDEIDQWVGVSLNFFSCAAVVTLGWLLLYLFYQAKNQHGSTTGNQPLFPLNFRSKASKGQEVRLRLKTVVTKAQSPVTTSQVPFSATSKPRTQISFQTKNKLQRFSIG